MSKQWIDTGNGEGIRFTKRSPRPEPVRIQYLVPESSPPPDWKVVYSAPSPKPVLAASLP